MSNIYGVFMKNNLNKAKEILEKNDNLNFVLINKQDEVYSSEKVGINLLVEIIEIIDAEGDVLKKSSVAFKNLDRGTAFLLAIIEAEYVFAYAVSRLALEVIELNELFLEFENKVEYISDDSNKMFIGEQCVLHIHERELDHAFWGIKQKIKELNIADFS